MWDCFWAGLRIGFGLVYIEVGEKSFECGPKVGRGLGLKVHGRHVPEVRPRTDPCCRRAYLFLPPTCNPLTGFGSASLPYSESCVKGVWAMLGAGGDLLELNLC